VLQAMQTYAGQFKTAGVKALFAKYGCPAAITELNPQQLETMYDAFSYMQPA